jgi:tetratricopeptide (TPR) repeat protein
MTIGDVLARFWLRRLVSVAVLLGRRQRSIELLQRLLVLAPGDAVARNALGNLLFESGDAAAAVDHFVVLLQRQPDNSEGWFNLGFIHESRDDLANAERCFRRAIELNPKIDRAWYGLGLTLIRARRLEEAIEALKRNTELQPFSPYGFYQLGMTYHHLGRDDEAWRVVEKLKGFEPKFAATLKRDIEQSRGAPRTANTLPSDTIHKEVAATIV